MDISRKEREELQALSMDVFGSSSKWRTILEKGSIELVTQTVIEEIPGENGAISTTKEVKVPVLNVNGTKNFVKKNYTVESVKALLQDLKVKKDEFMEMMKKQQEEDAAKKRQEELTQQVNKELSGSAV